MTDDAVLIAGATGAIGSSLAMHLSARGWRVGLGHRTSVDAANELAGAIRHRGGSCWLAAGDITLPDEATRMISEAPQSLRAVVYAAGPRVRLDYVTRLSPQEFSRAIDDDLKACINLFSASLPALRDNDGGALLAISTMAATRYASRDALSAIPKAGVEMLVKAIAREEGRFGIRCNAVSPGPVEADGGIWDWFISQGFYDDAALRVAREAIPLRRFGTPDDIAAAAAFLLSSQARWITGQVLCVDGGYSVG